MFSWRRARRASRNEDLRGRVGWVRSGGKSCHLLDVDGRVGGVGEDKRHRFGGEVAALHQPLVVLLEQQRAGEADHGLVVGEDPDDVRAAADLFVDALQRVRGAELGPVLARERVERGQVLFGFLEQLADLRRDRREALEHAGRRAVWPARRSRR